MDQCKDQYSKKRVAKNPSMYTCSGCKYQSDRQYNVVRHQDRIHTKKSLRTCCEMKFYTKGDYYIHCEQEHPETRAHAITSRTKYKMTNDMLAIFQEDFMKTEKREEEEEEEEEEETSHFELSQRYSQRIRDRKQRQMKSKLSLKYSVTYSDVDMENIPLISFLTDRRLKTYIKKFSSSKLANNTSKQNESANQTVKIAISSENNIGNVTTNSREENVRTTVSNSSVSSFSVELPTKKLLLQRFRSKHEFGIPLREQNNNICEQVNFAEHHGKENALPSRQSWPKYSKRTARANKENVSTFSFSLEQKLDIKLDTGIKVPIVTQLHRDFLASIDFDKFKMF